LAKNETKISNRHETGEIVYVENTRNAAVKRVTDNLTKTARVIYEKNITETLKDDSARKDESELKFGRRGIDGGDARWRTIRIFGGQIRVYLKVRNARAHRSLSELYSFARPQHRRRRNNRSEYVFRDPSVCRRRRRRGVWTRPFIFRYRPRPRIRVGASERDGRRRCRRKPVVRGTRNFGVGKKEGARDRRRPTAGEKINRTNTIKADRPGNTNENTTRYSNGKKKNLVQRAFSFGRFFVS